MHERPSFQNRISTFHNLRTYFEGKFPGPFKLFPVGRAADWFESTDNEWLADQAKDHEIPNSE